ncbi:hypothetical protein CYMTET_52387 [Cymbomonas tetramitiformis]|uniref:Uncharacterized protein n=1 Tax=Cymbomonas tetramitiformis TaxID=36881 RepID=A0AAE0BJ50_9CHLO|nr:hypothetical protein CYMTET_52387 [Cymbomonas tetramitiformis]
MSNSAQPYVNEIVIGDNASSWRKAGFSVGEDATLELGGVTLRFVGEAAGRGILSWGLSWSTTSSIDGLKTTVVKERKRGNTRRSLEEHANTGFGIDHIVLASTHVHRTAEILAQSGLVVKRASKSDSGWIQYFFKTNIIIELVGPDNDENAAADAPAKFWGLTVAVHDIDTLKTKLREYTGQMFGWISMI